MIADTLTQGQGYTLIGLAVAVVGQLGAALVLGFRLLRQLITANSKLANKVGDGANALAVNTSRIDSLKEEVGEARTDIRNIPLLTVEEFHRRKNRNEAV